MIRRTLCAVLLVAALSGQSVPNAGQRFTRLLNKAKEARQKNDKQALLASALEIARLLHYSGSSTEQLALAYGESGDQQRALQAFREFVVMGQYDDHLAGAPELSLLKSSPEFKRLLQRMKLNKSLIQRAATVAEFQDPGFVPEDLDYDAKTNSFLVTSVLAKKIVRISTAGAQKDFANAPDGWPMLAIKIDSHRGLVWATEVALNNFVAVPAKDWGRSAVLCLRLKDGGLVRRIEGPPHSALGDLAILPGGDPIVSDNDGGGVYRIRTNGKGDAMERVDGGEFISPQTPAALLPERELVVPDYVRGVGVLNIATHEVRWIESKHRHALQGIDGLYLSGRTLIAVQNGASPERVVLFQLDAGFTHVISEKIVERSTRTLGDPTHGVLVGTTFYYIGNSGWDSLDDNGRAKHNSKMTKGRIMKAVVK